MINQESNKLLTIAIPAYNRPEPLKLLLQNLKNELSDEDLRLRVEVVIVDNSTKPLEFKESYPWLRIYSRPSPPNLGPDGASKLCLEQSRGQYVWFLGDDDLIHEGGLRRVVNYLGEWGGVGLVILDYSVYDSCLEKELIHSVVRSDPNDAASVFSRLTFISIIVINRSYLKHSLELPYFDSYIGTFYYVSVIGMALGMQYGYRSLPEPIVKFRSGCSTLGLPFKLALDPYLLFLKIEQMIGCRMQYNANTFFKQSVDPAVRWRKKQGKLRLKHIFQIVKAFGVRRWFPYLLVLYLMPRTFLMAMKRLVQS